jgi:type 1 glutamine amidotransferase
MKTGKILLLAVAVLCCSLSAQDKTKAPSPAQPGQGAAKLRALIVTGDDVPAHNWRETTPVVREILESGGRFEVRVSEEPAVLATPALFSYDVVVLNYRDANGREPGEEAQKNLQKFVAEGRGLVAIHFAVNAFREWKEYRNIAGRVWVPKVSGHSPKGPFKVSVVKGSPLTDGLADFEIDDELYSALAGERELTVLATANSEFSHRVEPLAWTLPYEKGRVFGTVLGHDARARRVPEFSKLLLRGTEWAAGGSRPSQEVESKKSKVERNGGG